MMQFLLETVPVAAAGLPETVTTAMTTAFNAVKTDFISVLEVSIVPGLAIMGTVMAVKLGIRFFRSIAK